MKRAKFLWTDGVAVCANCLHGLASAPNIHLFQDSMDVIPHSELREIQAGSDFLICETLGDENHQLLLTYSEIGSWGGSLDWRLFDNVSNKVE